MKGQFAKVLLVILVFAGYTNVHAGEFYQGRPMEIRAAMLSPEKVALEQARKDVAECQAEHQLDYGSACAKVYAEGARAGMNYSHFVATGEHAPTYQPGAKPYEPKPIKYNEAEERAGFVKAVQGFDGTAKWKADTIEAYDVSHGKKPKIDAGLQQSNNMIAEEKAKCQWDSHGNLTAGDEFYCE